MTYGSDGQVADEIPQLLHHHGRPRQLPFHHRLAFTGEPSDQFVDLDDGAGHSKPRVGSSKNDEIGILHQRFGNRHVLSAAAQQFGDLHVIAGGAYLVSDITKSTRMIQNGPSLDRLQSGAHP